MNTDSSGPRASGRGPRAREGLILALGLILATTAGRAWAQAPSADPRVERLLQALVAEGVLTPDKAAAVAARLDAPAAAVTGPPSVAPAAASSPSGRHAGPIVSRSDFLKIDGDFRVRWQAEDYVGDAARTLPNYGALTGATALPLTSFVNVQDRARLRYRARLGFNAALSNRLTGVLRLAVGNETEPVSTDETLGDYFNRDDVVADRAFVRYDAGHGLALMAGRMANPFYATNMVWDGDVNPEGIAFSYLRPVQDGARLFANGGVFMLQENADDTPDRNLYALQVGVDNVPAPLGGGAKIGLAYYDYTHIRGQSGQAGTRNTVLQKGNSLIDIDERAQYVLPALASDFRIANLTGAISWPPAGRRLTLAADLAWNLGYDPGPKALLLTPEGGRAAWLVSAIYGDDPLSAKGAWSAGLTYRRIESDAVLAAFNEGDFNLGGTNSEGLTAELAVGLSRRTALQLQFMDSRAIVGPTYGFRAWRMTLNGRF